MPVMCPNCAQMVDDNAVFCDICGGRMPERPPAPKSAASPSPTPVATNPPVAPASSSPEGVPPGICPNCAAAYVVGEVFCNNCGMQLPPISMVAPPPPVQVAPSAAPPSPPPPQPPGVVPKAPGIGPAITHPPVQQIAGEQNPASPPPPPTITGHFIVQSTGQTINIPPGKTELLIGRSDPVASIFPDIDTLPYGGDQGAVSRRHARLLAQGEQVQVEDLGSTNFTYLNRVKLQVGQRYPLNHGDELRLGRLTLIYYA